MDLRQAEKVHHEKILIVDDDTGNLDILGNLLRPYYEVYAAPTGERALQIAAVTPKPDLILLDVLMPGMDGYEVLARLRVNPATRDIPVIFVTALNAAEDEEKGLELGAVDYISKPYQPSIILARVRAQLELKHARDFLAEYNRILEEQVEARTAELGESEERLRFATESMRDAFVILEAEHGIVQIWNHAAEEIFGYSREDVIGKPLHDFITPLRYREEANRDLVKFAITGEVAGIDKIVELMAVHKNGDEFPIERSITSVCLRGKWQHIYVMRDISERKHYQTQLEHQANFDDLTGLANRNLLTDRFAQAITRCRQNEHSLATLSLNLNRFKAINDSLGRGVGDQLLREVSDRLGAFSERVDTLSHFGADEFVVLVEDCGIEEITYLAQSILLALDQPYELAEHELTLSTSIGISVFPKDGEDGETLLKNAAAAMYRAKAFGGDSFNYYAAEMNTHSLERLNLENELRHAIERDELRLYYQPQVSLHNGEIIGMEALIRWQHPLRGMVPPIEFIPLAEETGLIVPIGEWVLRTACAQNQAWLTAGIPIVTVAVNLSAKQFDGQDIVALTKQVLRETGLGPVYLELELTESAAMGKADTLVGITEALSNLGVTLSIDDFGTGYSSLSYLKRFSIDRLKIDQSFVRDLVQDPESAAIVMAIIALAHGMGLSVIAEGVETEAQMSYLRTHGCDEMQGYYFSRPIPAAEFENLLREGRKLAFPATAELPKDTLLLVDDEPSILSALKRLLRNEGYQIFSATSAEEGMELLASHKIGVVMSDQRMPGMTGSEFLSRVRVMYPETVRIILSGYSDLKSITDVVNRGEIYKFMEKPWDDKVLLETVRESFRLLRARSERQVDKT